MTVPKKRKKQTAAAKKSSELLLNKGDSVLLDGEGHQLGSLPLPGGKSKSVVVVPTHSANKNSRYASLQQKTKEIATPASPPPVQNPPEVVAPTNDLNDSTDEDFERVDAPSSDSSVEYSGTEDIPMENAFSIVAEPTVAVSSAFHQVSPTRGKKRKRDSSDSESDEEEQSEDEDQSHRWKKKKDEDFDFIVPDEQPIPEVPPADAPTQPPTDPKTQEEPPKEKEKEKEEPKQLTVEDIILNGLLRVVFICESNTGGHLQGITGRCTTNPLWISAANQCIKKWKRTYVSELSPETSLLFATGLVGLETIVANFQKKTQ